MTRNLRHTICIFAAIVISLAAVIAVCKASRHSEISGRKMLCILEDLSKNDSLRGLVVGYNYHLIKKLAYDKGADIGIFLSDGSQACMGSIENGKADLAVIQYADYPEADSTLLFTPIDNISCFALSRKRHRMKRELDRWMADYRKSEEYLPTRLLFLDTYNPFREAAKGHTREHLSPYDSLFKLYADTAGCDWRLLAAIAYQESRFHIEANSRKGAAGLMQMMPHTAARMNVENLLDPQESISNAAAYFKLLYIRHRGAANEEERIKLALAAYNAGEGRIKQFTSMADSLNVDRRYWENVSALFDQVEDFKGAETRAYVDRVMALYDAMRKICPD